MRSTPPREAAKVLAANLARLRTHQRLSLSELAGRASVAKATLSDLEAGRGNPTLDTLWNLATGLGVSFSDLVSAPPTDGVTVARLDELPPLGATGEQARLLDRLDQHAVVDVLDLVCAPGSDRWSPAHGPKVTEALLVISGRLVTGPAGQERALDAGQLIHFPADQPHRYANPGSGPAHAIVWIAYPRL